MNETQEMLRMLLDELGPAEWGKVKKQEMLGQKLAQAIGMKKAWSRSYISAVIAGTLPASDEMQQAVRALAALTDGAPPSMAGWEPVTVYAQHNQIVAGSQVGEGSKMCSNQNCRAWFIPNNGRRTKCYTCSPVTHAHTRPAWGR